MKDQNKLLKLLSIVVIIFIVANVLVGLVGAKSAMVLPFLIISLGIYLFAHGTVRYGLKNILMLIGIGMVVSLFYESLSIATGFPFSKYHYGELLVGPKLLGFPVLVMIGYGLVAYTYWAVAEAVAGNFNNKLKGANIILIPLIAAALFTSLDYILDPMFATINQVYIWDNTGAFFGIPFVNYLGWYLTTYSIFQIFALIISRQKEREVPAIAKKKVYWYQSIVMYAAIFIQLPVLMMLEANKEIMIASGQVFQTNEIYQGITLVGIAAILVPAIMAFTVVYNSKELE